MNNSLLIGKHLYKVLSENEEIKKTFGDKIYPLVAENSTTFPYIIYYRNELQNISNTKDGFTEDNCTFSVVIVDTKYSNTIKAANRVRGILERKKDETEDFILYDTKLLEAEEKFSDGAYIQELRFTTNITNK